MGWEPKDFKEETTTIWSFPQRGNWATHRNSYRGNWSPYVPRNLILRYTKPGDWILDQFMGSGTTLVEAKLLNRNAVGIDINPQTLCLANENISFNTTNKSKIYIFHGDARNLKFIKNSSIDFVCTHPPYENIIKYSSNIDGYLSLQINEVFWESMRKVALESYRVFRSGKYCAIMMGDKRYKGNVVPLGVNAMQIFLKAGFNSKEIIIKQQHNCASSMKWQNRSNKFLLLAHEYIFVFYK